MSSALRNDVDGPECTGYPLTTKAAANFTRNELAHALRSGPYQVDLLVAGIDADGHLLLASECLPRLANLVQPPDKIIEVVSTT
eukprot:2714324-Amphidinium_carterae.1